MLTLHKPNTTACMQARKEKEQHILQLRMFENPKLVAELAARDAAAAKSQPSLNAPGAVGSVPNAAKAAARGVAKDEDSGGSGLFDDVGDDYEVDTSKIKQKHDKQGGKVCMT
jgi:hypothetical protein